MMFGRRKRTSWALTLPLTDEEAAGGLPSKRNRKLAEDLIDAVNHDIAEVTLPPEFPTWPHPRAGLVRMQQWPPVGAMIRVGFNRYKLDVFGIQHRADGFFDRLELMATFDVDGSMTRVRSITRVFKSTMAGPDAFRREWVLDGGSLRMVSATVPRDDGNWIMNVEVFDV